MADSSFQPSGKHPRSAASIRQVLLGVQKQVEPTAVGAHAQGLGDGEPLVVAALHDPEVAGRLKQRLRDAGVMFTTRTRARQIEFLIDAGDRSQVAAILRLHDENDPDRPPPAVRRSHDYLIFGMLIGAMSAVPIVFGTKAVHQGAAALLTLTILGAVGGHLLDRLFHARRRRGLLGIGLIGLLLAIAVIGGIVALGRLLPALLRQ